MTYIQLPLFNLDDYEIKPEQVVEPSEEPDPPEPPLLTEVYIQLPLFSVEEVFE